MLKNKSKILLMLVVLGLAAAACGGVSATSASCAFVVGNGYDGGDTEVHRIVYPGQTLEYNTGEDIYYVPCNSRNYIINDGSVVSASGVRVGDRNTQVRAFTQTGTPIVISVSAYWTLNQDPEALLNFYKVCLKYSCASSQDLNSANAGDQTVNNSTSGWIDMLDENFMPAMERAAKSAASQVPDDVWSNHSQEAYAQMADIMSREFSDWVRGTLGYPQDIFCGSGNSAWTDPENPGTGEFVCSPVRFVIDQVDRVVADSASSAESVSSQNAERLENARILYGEYAEFWLGLQDSIEKCNNSATACTIILDASGNPVVVPTMSAAPTTQPPVEEQGEGE